MKHGYYDLGRGVTVDLMFSSKADDKIAIISRIEVTRKLRGNGFASEIMQQVLDDADEEGYMLILAVESDGTGLSNEALAGWYERMGFKWMTSADLRLPDWPLTEVEDTGLVMVRKPRSN